MGGKEQAFASYEETEQSKSSNSYTWDGVQASCSMAAIQLALKACDLTLFQNDILTSC